MGFRSAGYHPGSADPKHSAHTHTSHLSAHTQNRGQAQGLADWVSVDFAKTPETGRCVVNVCVCLVHIITAYYKADDSSITSRDTETHRPDV